MPLQRGWMSHLGGNARARGLISVSLQGAAVISNLRPRRSWQDFCPAGKYGRKTSPSRCQPPRIAGASLLCSTCPAEVAQGSLQPGSFCSQEGQIQPFFPPKCPCHSSVTPPAAALPFPTPALTLPFPTQAPSEPHTCATGIAAVPGEEEEPCSGKLHGSHFARRKLFI